PEQVAGVIAHELAHIQKGHVMQKLVKEIGVSLLISATTGDVGGEVLKRTARTLSSTAFDRAMEWEADEVGVEYLFNSAIDPSHLADFFEELALSEPEMVKYFTWMSTHPDTQERADRIRMLTEDKEIESVPVMSEEAWLSLQNSINEKVENPWRNVE
ncbi:M48 family metallopeptidase, partial [Arthrospira platensis SPKY1]|nr:M48 family metallopeptidase [Arthrospira platensis SPKY1]